MNGNYQITSLSLLGAASQSPFSARRAAASLFNRALGQGLRSQLLAKLTRRSRSLQTLQHRPSGQQASRSRTIVVPLEKIIGSEGRSEDFDRNFNPLKLHNRDRWVGIAVARRRGVALPPVELVQDGDRYYVRDGHHRISVAKFMGQLDIEARVVN